MKKEEEQDNNEIIINLDDFKPMKLIISIENMTSRVSVFRDRKIYPKDKEDLIQHGDFPIELHELTDKGFILEVPDKCCSSGHMVKVTFETENKRPDEYFTFLTKVADDDQPLDEEDEKRARYQDPRQVYLFTIHHSDLEKLPRFEKMFFKNQEIAEELFETLRGR